MFLVYCIAKWLIKENCFLRFTRNTGFETTKGRLGSCFIVDCCDWDKRQSDDICGLDQKRLTGDEKIKIIFENSVLKNTFAKAGL